MAIRFIVLVALSLFDIAIAQTTPNLDDNEAVVVILGGGPSGIRAAAKLIAEDIEDIIILEPTDSLRGYLATVEFDGKQFAPGSLWAYSPSLDKLDEHSIGYKLSDYESYVVLTDNGDDVTAEADERFDVLGEAQEVLEKVGEYIDEGKRPDVSQKAGLARGGWIEASDVDRAIEWFDFDFAEGFSSRYTSTVGVYRQQDVFEGDYFVLDANYTLGDALLEEAEGLLEEGHVRYEQFGVSVEYSDDGVTVTTQNGTEYNAEYVIVAHTVGVLQRGKVIFDPPLPGWKSEEICRWQMATIDPVFMKFSEKFWGDEEYILYAGAKHGEFPAFLNLEAEGLYPEGTNILISFLTGDEATKKESKEDEDIIERVVEILRNIYGEDIPEPIDFYMSRFANDPYQYGSFASWPIGSFPEDAFDRLEGNIGRVYFALENAHDELIGLPYGSVRTGERAAEAIAECMDNDSYCESYEPVYDLYPPCTDEKPRKNQNRTKMRKNKNAQ